MIKYYTCPIIGDGTDDNSYRPKLADLSTEALPFAWSACISSNPDGTPKLANAFCVVNGNDLSAIDADVDCIDETAKTDAQKLALLQLHYPECGDLTTLSAGG